MCGPNSTGKTYVSYILFSIFSESIPENSKNFEKFSKNIRDEIKQSGKFTVTEDLVNFILNDICDNIRKNLLPSIFAIPDDECKILFKNFRLKLTLGEGEYHKLLNSSKISWQKNLLKNTSVNLVKLGNSPDINVVIVSNEIKDINIELETIFPSFTRLLYKFLTSLIFTSTDARMLTVERNSIYTFSKEISLTRASFDDRSFNPTIPQRYPLALLKSLRTAEDLLFIKKKKSDFYDYAIQLENNLLKGSIEVNEDGAIEFIPRSGNQTHLPVHMASSIVKTMASLVIYLKYIATKNNLLIIDEPEMNLHPDNQIILTRIFAELVNKGLNLVVSTHSDYIIREFNNMIMAKEIMKNKNDLCLRESVPYPANQMLSIKDTEVVYFNVTKSNMVKGKKLEVTEYGFDIESIDKTIENQTNITHSLADILRYGECNELL